MNSNDDLTREVDNAYRAAKNAWLGCDWSTRFGKRAWDLSGLKARQTRLLAAATSGEESQCWAQATGWLEQVEQDALKARSAAKAAIELFERHDPAMALAKIDEACGLEAKYHEQLVWGGLRELIGMAACKPADLTAQARCDAITMAP